MHGNDLAEAAVIATRRLSQLARHLRPTAASWRGTSRSMPRHAPSSSRGNNAAGGGAGAANAEAAAALAQDALRAAHPCWMELDASALRHNLAVIKELAGPGQAVVASTKGNACRSLWVISRCHALSPRL